MSLREFIDTYDREGAIVLELEDIVNHSFLPETCMHGDVSDFRTALEKRNIIS